MQNLTTEILQDHLFSVSKYSSYGGKLDQLLFGCELEYLIERVSEPGTFLLKDPALEFYSLMINNYQYSSYSKHDLCRISKDTKFGFIAVKPDFAYHVLEVSLPPRQQKDDLSELLTMALEEIDTCLQRLGYRRAAYSVVPRSPFHCDILELERHRTWLDFFPKRMEKSSLFYYPDYPAMMAATQIHLNILDSTVFERLSLMYELEWLVVRQFSKSQSFNARPVGCARVLLLEETLGAQYLLKTIPEVIPSNIAQYVEQLNRTPKYFPKDPFFSAKDYSFIRPRSFGSVEFRSACTQSTVEDILRLCAFRMLQVAYSDLYRTNPIVDSKQTSRLTMLNWAKTPKQFHIPTAFEEISLKRAFEALVLLPEPWRKLAEESIMNGVIT